MQKNIKNYWDKYWIKSIVFCTYFVILTWLLLRAANDKIKLPEAFYYNDKVSHVLAFLILTILSIIAFPRIKKWIIVGIVISYGVIIEFSQEAMKLGRTFEYLDILADVTGCLLGVIIIMLIKNKKTSD